MEPERFVFSISEMEKRVINSLDWFAIAFIPLFPVLIVLFGFSIEKAIHVGFYYALLMIPIIGIYRLHHKKFAFRITFDLENEVVVFDMLRQKGSISIGITEIDRITINYFMSFDANGKTILFRLRGVQGKKLAAFIEGRFPTAKGFWAKHFAGFYRH